MPEPTEQMPEVPEGAETPPQNLEDPGKVDAIFKEAAQHLEYTEDTPPEAKPEEELAAKPAPEPKKTKEKKKKDEPVTEPKEETPIEAAPEPKKSKRELFKEKADAEKAYRDKETKLKEREAKAQALLDEVSALKKQLDEDPVKYLESKDPRFYEKLTERYLSDKKTPDNAEMAAVKAELAALKEKLEGTHKETISQVEQAKYAQYMLEANNILTGEDFKDVREDAAYWEAFTGKPVDVDQVIASVYAEYKTQYNKELTPRECCEIILEDAQAHLESLPKAERLRALYGPEKPAEKPLKKKTPPLTGKTLTQKQETLSAPAQEPDLSQIKDKHQLQIEVAKMLEYEEVPEE